MRFRTHITANIHSENEISYSEDFLLDVFSSRNITVGQAAAQIGPHVHHIKNTDCIEFIFIFAESCCCLRDCVKNNN